MSKYPEHEKLKVISNQSQACGEFLNWLEGQGIYLCEESDSRFVSTCNSFHLSIRRHRDLLAEFFDIDENAIETEKRLMLEECRACEDEK